MNEEQYETIADAFEQSINAQVEYETTHDDAAGNYYHMPREGSWTYDNKDKELKEWIEEQSIDLKGVDIELVSEFILDNFEHEQGHAFGNWQSDDNRFFVAGYAVGEVEDQYCFDDWECSGIFESEEQMREFAKLAKDDRRFCLTVGDRDILSYTNTDSYWNFICSKESILEFIEDSL
jgi:hypothetical protein